MMAVLQRTLRGVARHAPLHSLSLIFEMRSARNGGRKPVFAGGHSGGATPVPIPNTVVKPASAHGTARATLWESRSPPARMSPPRFHMKPRGFVFEPPPKDSRDNKDSKNSRDRKNIQRPQGWQRKPSTNFVVAAPVLVCCSIVSFCPCCFLFIVAVLVVLAVPSVTDILCSVSRGRIDIKPRWVPAQSKQS